MRLTLISTALCGLPYLALGDPSINSPSCGRGCPKSTNVLPGQVGIPPTDDGNMQNGQSEGTPTTSSLQASHTDSRPGSKPKIGPIVGGVVGGVLFLALLGGLLFLFLRRKRWQDSEINHESAAVLEKSRASSPTSHGSPIYTGIHRPFTESTPPAVAAAYTDRQISHQAPPQPQPQQLEQPQLQQPQQQQVLPPQQIAEPAELQSREVDVDGVSVSSFDMQRPEERSVPRLPVYKRGESPGGAPIRL